MCSVGAQRGSYLPLLSPSWTPARVRINSSDPLWKTLAFNFRIFEAFLVDQNLSKNQTPQKVSKNLKNPIPCAPKAGFGSHFCTICLPIFDAFSRNISFLKTCIFPRQGPNITGPEASNFHQKSIPKSCLFRDGFLNLIFQPFMLFCLKKCDFWTPLGSAGSQNDTQNRLSGGGWGPNCSGNPPPGDIFDDLVLATSTGAPPRVILMSF